MSDMPAILGGPWYQDARAMWVVDGHSLLVVHVARSPFGGHVLRSPAVYWVGRRHPCRIRGAYYPQDMLIDLLLPSCF